MKKLVSVLLSITMILTLSMSAFAAESISAGKATTITEVENLLNSLPNTTTIHATEREMVADMLASNAITRQELNQRLTDLSHKPDSMLRQEGYNDTQIAVIKSYTENVDAYEHVFGSNSRSARADATVEIRYGLAGSNTQKDIGIAYAINWSACPFFTFTDSFGIGWIAADSNSYEVMTKTNSASGQVQYYTVNGADAGLYRDITMNTSSNSIVTGNPILGSADGNYGKKMGGYIQLSTQSGSSNISTIQVYVAYAHTTVKPSISASITIGWKKVTGAISFSANSNQSIMAQGHHTFKYSDQGEIVAK
ncbi:hypothetical protein ADH76_01015 [Enterocloster clostridioformis]|nr:hypothetical protein A4V08_03390 [Lachnoclostridium sp. YL32]NDO27620.1 hypothetical protein [Enterocloster clostridioformis]OXE70078.1 hypothetical protein ADH76_01015 [Enterocloster clostridioformis]QQR00221.1 hypothetical protein I5Q83_31250 [Enterocloster clostridioformis]